MTSSFSRLCRALSVTTYAVLAVSFLGLLVLAAMLAFSSLPELWAAEVLSAEEAEALVLWQRIGLWVLAALGMTPVLLMFSTMGRLFSDFAASRVFTEASATAIRRIGWLLIIAAGLTVVLGAARSVLVSVLNAPGERQLAIAFGSDQIILALLGGFVVVIGQAMREAARIEAENKGII